MSTTANAPALRTPVSLLTGFLGSGKTTLLGRLIRHPGMADTAVIINEFGEIGLDHHLVEAVSGEAVLLASGCVCCTIRDDLAATLRELHDKRERGEIPAFRRVVIETTGLADPAPIIHSLLRHADVRQLYALDSVISTIDAVNAEAQLDRQPESVKQAAVADRLVLTKTDLVDEARTEALLGRLARLNPGADVVRADRGEVDPARLFEVGALPRHRAADTAMNRSRTVTWPVSCVTSAARIASMRAGRAGTTPAYARTPSVSSSPWTGNASAPGWAGWPISMAMPCCG